MLRWLVGHRWSAPALVVMLWAGGPSPSLGAEPDSEEPASTQDFDTLMARGEQQREEGDHAAAARSYAAAYGALPGSEQSSLRGEIALDNAMADYRAAIEATPDDVTLLDESIALLAGFIVRRKRAAADGEAEAVPPRLIDALEELREQRDALREDAAETESDADLDTETDTAASTSSSGPTPRDTPPSSRTADIAILAGGVVGIIGGTALIASGAWNRSRVRQISEEQLGALNSGPYSDEVRAQYRTELTQWQQQWFGAAAGLIAGGVVLAGAGVGLLAWGAVRMQRHDRSGARASIGAPMVSRQGAGLWVRVEF